MRLRTRLFLATAAVTTVTAAAVGLAGTLYAYDSEVKRLDKVLAKVSIDAIDAAPNQIAAAIESAADRSFAVQVSILALSVLLANSIQLPPLYHCGNRPQRICCKTSSLVTICHCGK